MNSPVTARFVVSGKVQGVWFRASTREQALKLGLHGYANNLADGAVEVVVRGDALAIESLQRWLWQGPPLASVTALVRETFSDDVESGFRTA